MYIYTKEKKVGCGFIATPQGTPPPVSPLAYGIEGLRTGDSAPRNPPRLQHVCMSWNYARLTIFGSCISVVRSMVPVCRDGIMSLNCFLMGPNTGSLILT